MGRWLLLALIVGAGGCGLRPAEERARDDLDIGYAAGDELSVAVVGGHAHVRSVTAGAIELWAQSPTIELTVTVSGASDVLATIVVANCMPDAELVATHGANSLVAIAAPPTLATRRSWSMLLPGAATTLVRVATVDADVVEDWRFAVMGDIQEAIAEVDDLFREIAADPSLRFVVSAGDLVDRGRADEYAAFITQLEVLPVPYYSTIGNHELYGDIGLWREHFGRVNLHFEFKGSSFTLVDSGDATIDPQVYEWLEGWLAGAADKVHVFLTHIPPLDPVGVRAGAFRSRGEAIKLLSMLAAGAVDVTFYGHIHSYYAFTNAGIPAYISGGGGAWPERWDSVGRHFLAVEVAGDGVASVATVEID